MYDSFGLQLLAASRFEELACRSSQAAMRYFSSVDTGDLRGKPKGYRDAQQGVYLYIYIYVYTHARPVLPMRQRVLDGHYGIIWAAKY